MSADRPTLIEQTVSAHRARDPQGVIRWAPAWYDLDADARVDAYEATVNSRVLEAALDPRGLSSTAHAVLARIRGRGPGG